MNLLADDVGVSAVLNKLDELINTEVKNLVADVTQESRCLSAQVGDIVLSSLSSVLCYQVLEEVDGILAKGADDLTSECNSEDKSKYEECLHYEISVYLERFKWFLEDVRTYYSSQK